MARKHVINYFLEVQNQYFDMKDTLNEIQEAIDEGYMTQEQYEEAKKDVEILKSNYERISYIVMLLNKPNRKDAREDAIAKSWYQALKGASKEAILDENKDALADLKAILKKEGRL